MPVFIADSVPNPLRELHWIRSKWKKGKDGFIYFSMGLKTALLIQLYSRTFLVIDKGLGGLNLYSTLVSNCLCEAFFFFPFNALRLSTQKRDAHSWKMNLCTDMPVWYKLKNVWWYLEELSQNNMALFASEKNPNPCFSSEAVWPAWSSKEALLSYVWSLSFRLHFLFA